MPDDDAAILEAVLSEADASSAAAFKRANWKYPS
jgi:hypothetical protein